MNLIIKIGGCVTALTVIVVTAYKGVKSIIMIFKGIKEENENLSKTMEKNNNELKNMIIDLGSTIKKKDYNECKRYLTDFLADLRNGFKKTDIQKLQFFETYKHYKEDLKGNDWITNEYEDLHNQGLI